MCPEVHTEHEYPPIGQTVTRFDHCYCFAERRSLLAIDHICKYPENQEIERKIIC